MGTRSLIIMRVKHVDGTYTVWSVLYQQYDGDLRGVGAQLCKFLLGMRIVDGFNPYDKSKVANGAGCLFAQLIAYFKVGVGGAYLEAPYDYELQGWNYYVDINPDNSITLSVFNDDHDELFEGTPEEFQKQFELNTDIKTPKEEKDDMDYFYNVGRNVK